MIKLSQVKSHIGLVVVLLIYLGLTIYTSWRVPLSVGPDEVAHFMLARFLRQEVRLPVSAEDLAAAGYKSDQPPLNSIFIAFLLRGNLYFYLVPFYDKPNKDTKHFLSYMIIPS